MGENEDEKQAQASQVFENFVQATTCKGTLQAFNVLTCLLDLDPLDHRNFYSQLKSKVNTWKAKALWHKLDKRGAHKEYKRGKACMNTKVREPPRTFLMEKKPKRCYLAILRFLIDVPVGAILWFSGDGFCCLEGVP